MEQTPIIPELQVEQPLQDQRRPKLQLIVLVVACILLALSALFGIASGFSSGRSKATVYSAGEIAKALAFYNSDQSRYPSADQFYNQKILIPNYMDSLPLPQDSSGSCQKYSDFVYAQSSPQTYILEFCLTSGANGLKSGLHAFTEKGLE